VSGDANDAARVDGFSRGRAASGTTPVDALCRRLIDARARLEREGPAGAAEALEGLDAVIDAAVDAAPTPADLSRVRAALEVLEQTAALASDRLRRALLQGGAGAKAEKAYQADRR